MRGLLLRQALLRLRHPLANPGAGVTTPHVWVVFGRVAPAWCDNRICTLGQYIFTSGNPTLLNDWAHEYVHVLQYEGRGLGFATSYIANVVRCSCTDANNEDEAVPYLWEAWTSQFAGFETMPWRIWTRPPK